LDIVKLIIYRYDTSCCGALDFEDFLEFLADYWITIELKREAARKLYASHHGDRSYDQNELAMSMGMQPGNQFLNAALKQASNESDFLSFLNLDDPECLWVPNDTLMRTMQESGIVSDFVILKRHVTVRVLEGINLSTFCRIKKRVGHGIEYITLDPFVQVTIAGQSKRTSSFSGSNSPRWDHELSFDFTIPPGEVHDIVHWVHCCNVDFEVYDLNNEGAVAYGELLARGSLPLSRILHSVRRPFDVIIPLSCLDGFERSIALSVQITDRTQERGTFAKVLEVCPRTEDIWMRKFPDKFKRDLSIGKQVGEWLHFKCIFTSVRSCVAN
jgi:hypothetical protein